MAKTTPHQTYFLRLEIRLSKRLRKDAQKKHETLNAWIEEAIRQRLERDEREPLAHGRAK